MKIVSEKEVPIISFWMSQALSGHGVFGEYLHRCTLCATALCKCGSPSESPRHIFTECIDFAVGRPPVLNVGECCTRNYLILSVMKLWKEENRAIRRNQLGTIAE